MRPARLDSGQTIEARIAPESLGSHGQESHSESGPPLAESDSPCALLGMGARSAPRGSFRRRFALLSGARTPATPPCAAGIPASYRAVRRRGGRIVPPSAPPRRQTVAAPRGPAPSRVEFSPRFCISSRAAVTWSSLTFSVCNFPAELAQAGGSTESLASETNRHLERLRSIGATVFRRWVDTIQIRGTKGVRPSQLS